MQPLNLSSFFLSLLFLFTSKSVQIFLQNLSPFSSLPLLLAKLRLSLLLAQIIPIAFLICLCTSRLLPSKPFSYNLQNVCVKIPLWILLLKIISTLPILALNNCVIWFQPVFPCSFSSTLMLQIYQIISCVFGDLNIFSPHTCNKMECFCAPHFVNIKAFPILKVQQRYKFLHKTCSVL